MTLTIPNRHTLIPAVYLALLATTFTAFTYDGKNVLLIGFSVIGWIVAGILYFRSFPKLADYFLAFILAFMLVSAFINFERSQWTSIGYSVFFVASYLFYTSFMRTYFSADDYARVLGLLIVLFFVGLVMGQIYFILFGFSPTHVSGGIMHGAMGMTIEQGRIRFHSLASEPSYASFIVITLYYSYTRIRKLFFSAANIVLLLMLVYMIVFFRSGYGAVLFILLIISFLGFSRKALIGYLVAALLGFLALMFIEDLPFLTRILTIAERIELDNLHSLASIDHPVYYRVAPVLHYFRISDPLEFNFWFGYGASASRTLAIPETFLASQGEFLGGFMPAFFYDYGLVGALLVLAFIGRLLPRFVSLPTAIVILLLFNANFNTQLFWVVITCLSMNSYFSRQETNEPSTADT